MNRLRFCRSPRALWVALLGVVGLLMAFFVPLTASLAQSSDQRASAHSSPMDVPCPTPDECSVEVEVEPPVKLVAADRGALFRVASSGSDACVRVAEPTVGSPCPGHGAPSLRPPRAA